jgi:TetR/AcrR family transcriptional repressor of nem operon
MYHTVQFKCTVQYSPMTMDVNAECGHNVPMARTETRQPARERILDTALDLFHQKGVSATSVDEILEGSGTGKSQFAHYFKNKDGLIRAAVAHFEGKLERREMPVRYEVRSFRDLKAWFQVFIDFQRTTGCARSCPMGTIANSLTDDQDAIRSDVDRVFRSSREVLDSFFEDLVRRKKLPPRARPEELADFCYSIMQGGLIVSKVRRDVTPFENSVKHALAYVRHLIRGAERS